MVYSQVYHSNFWPLEWTVAAREDNICYAKLICVKSLDVSLIETLTLKVVDIVALTLIL